jgi:putative DNA primase/helicase
MAEKLKEEAPAILSWLVRGCIQWQEQGLAPPDKVKAATQQYRRGEDVIGHFIEERCVLEFSAYTKAKKLYDEYKAWCEENGHRPLSGTKFGEKMAERFEKARTEAGKIYYGVGILHKS